MRRVFVFISMTFAAALVLSAPASAADRPKARTIYRDGPSGRYLVDRVACRAK